jgi:hypothetical protein
MNDFLKLQLDAPLATPYEIRRKICRMEFEMLQAVKAGTFQERDYPLKHQFAPGLYIRTIFLPAGDLVIGSIHKYSHFNYITKGRVSVLTEGEGFRELVGYWEETTKPLTKRAIFVHEDTFWTTVHPTDETDPDVIRSEVTAESYAELGLEDPMIELQAMPVLGEVA